MLIFNLASCEVSEKESVYAQPAFTELVNLQCEARKLKNERFTLAEKLRQDESYVSNPDSLKKALASQGRELGDRIRQGLDHFTTEMSLDQKRTFSDSMEARIARLDCD
jgi:hypothetical protein